MSHSLLRWLKNRSLKAKLCFLTVLLLVVMMLSVGSIVLEQQRRSLMLQMEETGRFLVKNLAKNVVGPLLEGDSLNLNNLINSLEARDSLEGNPARFSRREYAEFLRQNLLEDKISALKPFIKTQGNMVYLHVDRLSADAEPLRKIGRALLQDVLSITAELETQEQYDAFFTQYPLSRTVVESLSTLTELEPIKRVDAIPQKQREELITLIAEKIYQEILTHVKNQLIGYAIIVDKDNLVQAHPYIERLGEPFSWPESTEVIKKGDEINIHRVFFRGESHFDFSAPILVRDKHIGSAHIGSVHIGLREDNVLKEIQSARLKILSLSLVAVLLGSLASYFLASVFVKPIKGLVKDAEILGAGDLEHQIQAGRCDEVGTLATTLNTTRIKLRDAQKRLVASERLARELEIASEIQMTLLPKETPQLEHVEIGALYRAAAQVGGDLYDFFWVSNDELGIVVADVSGKGVPGSLVMTMAKAVIRAKAVKPDMPNHTLPVDANGDPVSVICNVNQMIHHDIKKGMFITANYSVLNVKNLQFKFVSAGHNDTLVYNSYTRELHEYNPKGIALGLDQGSLFDKILQSHELNLQAGDFLIQYTDGISEAMNEKQEEFGNDRLKEIIRKYAHQNVNDFLQSLDREIRSFTKSFAQSDDITAVVLKVK
ncbi:hypothetical protein CSB45_03150 [candidate division KSB3 bacterium]|uniref:HAMP domain-containing protein n=1 Tax=candidate division KSB3 bacterium TaxID=2044937 RepID=A0A2G6E915_9BACT|nr:MAG: hypothetical protein CSB45_03150 [candidate division KSB3 bacterium]